MSLLVFNDTFSQTHGVLQVKTIFIQQTGPKKIKRMFIVHVPLLSHGLGVAWGSKSTTDLD